MANRFRSVPVKRPEVHRGGQGSRPVRPGRGADRAIPPPSSCEWPAISEPIAASVQLEGSSCRECARPGPSIRPAAAARLAGVSSSVRIFAQLWLACVGERMRLRLRVDRADRADPGGDGRQLGTPRLRTSAARRSGPRRRLAAPAARPRRRLTRRRPASSTASRSTASSQLVPFAQIGRIVPRARALSRRAAAHPPAPPPASACRSDPSITAGPKTGSPAFCNSPCLSATRQPSKLPLSTVEMYRGGSGCRVRGVVPVVEMAPVLFQPVERVERLLQPVEQSAQADVAEVVGGQGRDQQEPLVGRRCPVGDPASGISWKLSGGSQWSSSPTKVSKKCQVLRAMRRAPGARRRSGRSRPVASAG